MMFIGRGALSAAFIGTALFLCMQDVSGHEKGAPV